VTRHSTCRN